MNHLLLEIVSATEVAALAAYNYIGSGDKFMVDKVATKAMRNKLNQINFSAVVSVGEGLKDSKNEKLNAAEMGIYKGERLGANSDLRYAEYDIANDVVEGTTQVAQGGYEAMSVIAMAKYNCLMPVESFYMNKIAVGKEIAKHYKPKISIALEENIANIRKVLGKEKVTVCVLNRPRHEELIKKLRVCGCIIKLIQDCDVSGVISAALPNSGIDAFMGIGGSPEGVISAAAIKCLDGYFEGSIVTNDFKPTGEIYSAEELAKGDVIFAATGILNGSLLKGIRQKGKAMITDSILMESKTKSIKRIKSYH